MYPVRLGYDAAKNRIEKLICNGHHAEALLTSVFTLEKIIHRTLRQLLISAGFTSSSTKVLLSQLRGFSKQKEVWKCFDPRERSLAEVVASSHWQHINKAVEMRNKTVHGVRVYKLAEYQTQARLILLLLDDTVAAFQSVYGYDGWGDVSRRIKPKLHSDPKVDL